MADASARVTGEVGVFSVVPGPGLTNAMTGIGEALLDSVPIVGIITDVEPRPARPDRPGPFAPERGDPPADRQGRDRGPPPVRDPRRDPPGVPAWPGRASRAPSPSSSRSPSTTWPGTSTRASPALPRPVRRVGVPARCSATWPTGGSASGSTRASAASTRARRWRPWPNSSRPPWPPRSAARGASPTPTRSPSAGGTASKGRGRPSRRSRRWTSCSPSGVKFSEVSTANYAIPKHDTVIHVDANPHNLGRNVPAHVTLCADSRVFFDRLLADAEAIRRPPCPALCNDGSGRTGGRPRREHAGPGHGGRRPDGLPDPAPRRPRVRTS